MKKGFTLIELLAVIVILAIIALIATPIVLDIINDAKASTMLRNAEYYMDVVEQSIMKKSMDIGSSYKPDMCIVKEDGNILCDNTDTLIVEVKGVKPEKGTITFNDGKIADISLILENKIISRTEKGELIFGQPLVDYIKNIYSETKTTTVNEIEYSLDENHMLMNDRLGSKDIFKTEGNIRYYGANPNNYIDIGDRDSEGNIIFWRIIGVFKDIEVTDEHGNVIRTEDLVKIIRAENLTSGGITGFSWDYTSAGAYDNNWNDSTLQVMLNDEVNGYYASGTTNYYNNSTTPIELNFNSTGLSREVRSKIERVDWNFGGHNTINIYTDAMYGYERTGTNTWSGKIALMHLSDYGYSVELSSCQTTLNNYNDSKCTSTNWMYDSIKPQWAFTPNSSHAYGVFYVNPTGYASYNSNAGNAIGVRPVLYLKSNVSIAEEKETNEGLKYLVIE